MRNFKKLPVVISAVQFVGGPASAMECIAFAGLPETAYTTLDSGAEYLHVGTLEGTMRADVGDWIIRGVKGETYPCKPDIFAATYEPALVASEGDQRTVNNTMRHQYRQLGEAEKATMVRLKDQGLEMIGELRLAGGQREDTPEGTPFASRELSLAATKVEEAVMWAVKHVTR